MKRKRRAIGIICTTLIVVALIGPALLAQTDSDKAKGKLLFDGKTLKGWKSTDFGGEGNVVVKDGAVVMERGGDMTGITYTRGDFPRIDYEISLEAKRVMGSDFFATTTFPVGKDYCSLVLGGWGGTVVGLSSLDDRDASENDSGTLKDFKQNQWYRVRIRVTAKKIAAWIDDKQMIDQDTTDRRITIRAECDPCKPFGIATWRTEGAVRDIRIRTLTAAEKK